MKFKTFKALIIAGGIGLVGLGGYSPMKGDSQPNAGPPAVRMEAPERPVEAAKAEKAYPGLREVDNDLLERAAKPLAGDKAKDAFRGRSYKVNLYSEAGSGRVDRAKIDLDRDEKWDEKWSFKGGEVKREVAPGDDEKYSESYRLREGLGVKK